MSSTARYELTVHAAKRSLSFRCWEAVAANQEDTPRAPYLKRFVLADSKNAVRKRLPVDVAKVPSRIWSTVLDSPSNPAQDLQGFSVSAAILLVGRGGAVREALRSLGLSHLSSRIHAEWTDVFGLGDEADRFYDDILSLQRALAIGEVPVNYTRRRATFTAPVPHGVQHRNQLAAGLGTPLTPRLASYASWYIYELLTGSDFLVSPQGIHLPGTHRPGYRRQRAAWDAEKPAALHRLAEMQLYRRNISEPVTWTPTRVGDRWVLPNDDVQRYLDVWPTSKRRIRSSARSTHDELQALTPAGFVALALRGTGPTAERARVSLSRFRAIAEAGTMAGAARRNASGYRSLCSRLA